MDTQTAIENLTLMLASLDSREVEEEGNTYTLAFANGIFSAFDSLQSAGYLAPVPGSQTMAITEEGKQRAKELLQASGIKVDAPN